MNYLRKFADLEQRSGEYNVSIVEICGESCGMRQVETIASLHTLNIYYYTFNKSSRDLHASSEKEPRLPFYFLKAEEKTCNLDKILQNIFNQ